MIDYYSYLSASLKITEHGEKELLLYHFCGYHKPVIFLRKKIYISFAERNIHIFFSVCTESQATKINSVNGYIEFPQTHS